jgi:hypothetical protein
MLLIVGVTICAFPQEKKTEVAAFLRDLRHWQLGKSKQQPKITALNHLRDEILPLLAEFLTDREFGDTAEGLMVEIDPEQSAPLIFASMPRSDRNVQYHAFRFFIRRIQNGERFDYAQAMHDAAVRCLEADSDPYPAEQALLAIGLTGSTRDFPLLEKYFNNTEPIENWRASVRNASEASLARLGHTKYLDNIIRQLSSTFPTKISLQMAVATVNSIREAEFTRNQRFVPLLCKKLEGSFIEMGPDSGHAIPPSTAGAAANALASIVDGASPDETASVNEWSVRCKGSIKKQ